MNNEDMSDVIKNLSSMLNGANIPDNVKDMLNNLQSPNSDSNLNSENLGSSGANFNNSGVSSDSSPSFSPEMFEKLSSLLNGNSSNSTSSIFSDNSQGSNIDMETLLKISKIISKMNSSQNDARANLLLSLKPYLKESRKSKVEQYVKLLNMSKVLEIINPNGSEKVK